MHSEKKSFKKKDYFEMVDEKVQMLVWSEHLMRTPIIARQRLMIT